MPLKDHLQCEHEKNKSTENHHIQNLKDELIHDKASMLIDIMSPEESEEACKLIKLREKVKKRNEAKHQSDYQHLLRVFDVVNPAKKIRESFRKSKGLLLFEEFENFKSWNFQLATESSESND